MSVIVGISVPADEFELGCLFQQNPGLSVRLERVVPSDTMLIPYFWIDTVQFDSLVQLIEESEVIDDVSVVDEAMEETLFRVVWAQDPDTLLTVITEAEGTLQEVCRVEDAWSFEVRFTDLSLLSTFFHLCDDKSLTVNLEGMYPSAGSWKEGGMPLSPDKVELVQYALEGGYYDNPQQITLSELSAEVGLSEDTLAAQLHEAEATVLKSV